MNRLILVCLILIINTCKGIGSPSPANADFEMLRKKVTDQVMAGQVNESRIRELMTSLGEDGHWAGINYENVSLTGFQHTRHTGNLVEMARAYKKMGTSLSGDKSLKQAINIALDFWLRNDFQSDNWWHNQIGVPTQMCNFLLIMDKDLSSEQIKRTGEIVGRAHLNASGARPSGDRIKIAGILAKHLLFKHDEAGFNDVIRVIEGEIKFATGRGMQYDYSFHHRPDRVNNTLSYGLDYADVFAEWADFVAGTIYKFTEKPVQQLVDYYLDGICKMMVYGKYSDPGARNRDISRQGRQGSMSTTALERLLKITDYRRNELEQIIRIRKGTGETPISHSTFFWQSEHFTFQRPDFFTSVRMFSTRNANMEEPYNEEGLTNHHRGDGANYISRTGLEYNEVPPVYDWQKIPGTTVVQKPELPSAKEIQKMGLTDFVGAVTDGMYGAVAFDFKSPHDPLVARKSWFFFDKEYVCLGAGISEFLPIYQSGDSLPVVTTVNQCSLKGDVVVMNGNQKSTILKGDHQLDEAKWILHDGIGYLFPEKQKIHLTNQAQSGSWYLINHQSGISRNEVKIDIFKLWIEHGSNPQNAGYQYIVVPSANESEMERRIAGGDIRILANTREIQAVQNTNLNIVEIVFYKAGGIQLDNGLTIMIDSPGMVIIKMDRSEVKQITVSDPSRKNSKIHLTVTGKFLPDDKNYKSVWNADKGVSEIAVELPQAQWSGSSVSSSLM